MSKSLEPGNEGREQLNQAVAERLARHKKMAAELVEAVKIEGAFDKPKEKLFLEIGANTNAGLSIGEQVRAYREGATIVTVDSPAEMGKTRGDTGFGAPALYSELLGVVFDATAMTGWGDTVENSESAYDPDRIKAAYKADPYIWNKPELDTPESSTYRVVKLYADGQDLSFFRDDTFGTVVMQDVLSDPSIPERTLASLVAEALRVGDELWLRNPTTSDFAAGRLRYANLDQAGIDFGYIPRDDKTDEIDWELAGYGVILKKNDKFGEVPLSIPSYHEIIMFERNAEYEEQRAQEKAATTERKRLRREKFNAQLAKIGLRKKA
ncbi:MAG: hypothetical protein ABI716_03410 [Candidatus Saccharibacteria bacterium]